MTVEWPDVEGALRTYLRAHTDVSAIVAQRVFFGVPDTPTYPLVTVARVGGFDEASEAPIDQALVQIDCWADVHPGTRNAPDKATADQLRRAVRQALYELRGTTAVTLADDSVVRLSGAVIQSDPYLEDPDNRRPRYAITAQLTAHQLTPTP